MSSDMFNLDLGEMLKLRKFMKRSPKQFHRVAIGVLNTAAFGTRTEAIKELRSNLIIRNDRFLKSSVRVQKASTRESLNRAESTIGSIGRNRFSGWIEQQTGQSGDKTRTSTSFGRGGSASGDLPVGSRFKRKNILSPDRFPGSSPESRSIAMINSLKRRNYTRSFIIKGNRKFKGGLYKIKGRKRIAAVQKFNSKPVKPKRLTWLTNARSKFLRSKPLREIWARNIRQVLKL